MVGKGIWSTGYFFPLPFQLRAVTLEETDRPSLLIRGSVAGVTATIFGFFSNGVAYMAPGLLVSDGIHLSQRGKRIFAHKLARLID